MPMIDTDLIKPASDAVDAAFNEWWRAGQALGQARQNRLDGGALVRAEGLVETTHANYIQLAKDFARAVHVVIRQAEASAR